MTHLDSIECKIFRAAQHIKLLHAELHRYFKSNPGIMVAQPNTTDNEAFFGFRPKSPVPARFGLIIGDSVQNLRSALDYLVWELVLAAKNQPTDKNMFPICSTPEAFEDQIGRRRLDGVPVDAIAQIRSLQPYHLGQDWNKHILWALDELTNINKHRRILLTNLMAGLAKRENFVMKDGEIWYGIDAGPMPTFDSNTQFGPYPVIEGKVYVKDQFIAAVAFDEGAAKGMEVGLCMDKWAEFIAKVLVPPFEKFLV